MLNEHIQKNIYRTHDTVDLVTFACLDFCEFVIFREV